MQGLKKTEKVEDNMIKDVRNLFRFKKKKIDGKAIKDIRNHCKLKKKMKKSKTE